MSVFEGRVVLYQFYQLAMLMSYYLTHKEEIVDPAFIFARNILALLLLNSIIAVIGFTGCIFLYKWARRVLLFSMSIFLITSVWIAHYGETIYHVSFLAVYSLIYIFYYNVPHVKLKFVNQKGSGPLA